MPTIDRQRISAAKMFVLIFEKSQTVCFDFLKNLKLLKIFSGNQ